MSHKPSSTPERHTRTTMDTIQFTRAEAEAWVDPPFQRPLHINDKVREVTAQLQQNGGVLSGVLTLGILDKVKYLVDGQHRRRSFMLTSLQQGFADVRICHFDTMAEMGEEYVRLNTQIVKLRPDDLLRGLEGSLLALKLIRASCPFVGYDMIRRNERAPVVSMSAVLRCWTKAMHDVPSYSASAATMAGELTMENAEILVRFLKLAYTAWGRDTEVVRFWGSLNLTLCMWLYRRTVVASYSLKTLKFTNDLFGKCLMALTAETAYYNWLLNRQLRERERAPAYNRIKSIFTRRVLAETGAKANLPSPPWAPTNNLT